MQGFTIAIVGRPNVGKSTLFNRLLEQRKSIVDNLSGVTRDRQYGISDWNGKGFNVIDTGGFVSKSDDVFEKEINKQVMIAIREADVLLFLVDVTAGVTDLDEDVANILRRSNKPVILVVNKVDNHERFLDATEFYVFGFEHNYFISSVSGSGTGELLDAITDMIPEDKNLLAKDEILDWDTIENEINESNFQEDLDLLQGIEIEELPDDFEEKQIKRPEGILPRITIIGQPNAGKSTLLNALIGEERAIVSDIPGTTRDTVHTIYKQFGKEFVLIDTAGLRKKKNVNEDLEFYSVIRAIKAMDEADVCMLLIDAEKGITAQDINIFSLVARKGKGIVVLVNKWDKIEDKTTNSARDYEKILKERLKPFADVPIVFVSAKDKTRIFKAVETALKVYDNRYRKIPTSHLNDVMLREVKNYPPPMVRGYSVKIKFAMQLPTYSPAFAFYTNHPDQVREPYRNFLENKLRSHFNFKGVPLRIFFRKK